jgi:hypothetical protein
MDVISNFFNDFLFLIESILRCIDTFLFLNLAGLTKFIFCQCFGCHIIGETLYCCNYLLPLRLAMFGVAAFLMIVVLFFTKMK